MVDLEATKKLIERADGQHPLDFPIDDVIKSMRELVADLEQTRKDLTDTINAYEWHFAGEPQTPPSVEPNCMGLTE